MASRQPWANRVMRREGYFPARARLRTPQARRKGTFQQCTRRTARLGPCSLGAGPGPRLLPGADPMSAARVRDDGTVGGRNTWMKTSRRAVDASSRELVWSVLMVIAGLAAIPALALVLPGLWPVGFAAIVVVAWLVLRR